MGLFRDGKNFDWEHELFLFVHIPKCGGTSIHELFKTKFLDTYEVFVNKKYDRNFLKTLNGAGGHQLNGQSPLDAIQGKSFKKLCLIRHPVDRVLSLYKHVMRFPKSHPLSKFEDHGSFEDYNVINFAKVCIQKNVPELSNYCSNFILGSWEEPSSFDQIIEKLHQDFKFFSVIEFMETLQNELCEYFEINSHDDEIIHTNKSSSQESIPLSIKKDLSALLHESGYYDFELYNYIYRYNCKEIQDRFRSFKKIHKNFSNV